MLGIAKETKNQTWNGLMRLNYAQVSWMYGTRDIYSELEAGRGFLWVIEKQYLLTWLGFQCRHELWSSPSQIGIHIVQGPT